MNKIKFSHVYNVYSDFTALICCNIYDTHKLYVLNLYICVHITYKYLEVYTSLFANAFLRDVTIFVM